MGILLRVKGNNYLKIMGRESRFLFALVPYGKGLLENQIMDEGKWLLIKVFQLVNAKKL